MLPITATLFETEPLSQLDASKELCGLAQAKHQFLIIYCLSEKLKDDLAARPYFFLLKEKYQILTCQVYKNICIWSTSFR